MLTGIFFVFLRLVALWGGGGFIHSKYRESIWEPAANRWSDPAEEAQAPRLKPFTIFGPAALLASPQANRAQTDPTYITPEVRNGSYYCAQIPCTSVIIQIHASKFLFGNRADLKLNISLPTKSF
jgi:hypothetical protein